MRSVQTEAIGLYVHFPFCRSKCPYCHFASVPFRSDLLGLWFEGLEKEIARHAAAGLRADTLYVGGGTPSLLGAGDIARMLEALRAGLDLDLAEFTLEANPDPRDVPSLAGWRDAGVTRISVGVQSFDDRMLGVLGRTYTARQAEDFVRSARRAGFPAVGIDLMVGVPTETPDGLGRTMRAVADLGPDHVSLYIMENLEGLPFESFARAHSMEDDEAADAYEFMREGLDAAGLRRYEISNFAREGAECLHNLKYWRYEPFLGLGPSACSHIGAVRWCNKPAIEDWAAGQVPGGDPRGEVRELTPEASLREALVSGLRIARGVRACDLAERFGIDVLDMFHREIGELRDDGLLVVEDGTLRIPEDKFLISNAVFSRFV
ncbi:MAG TPA: radical SAM family heme chaperone HemW [Acidobacteriota bacterium]|nr:radical SAM family heme chaperone HemW [Acidobacteriota bacterium]